MSFLEGKASLHDFVVSACNEIRSALVKNAATPRLVRQISGVLTDLVERVAEVPGEEEVATGIAQSIVDDVFHDAVSTAQDREEKRLRRDTQFSYNALIQVCDREIRDAFSYPRCAVCAQSKATRILHTASLSRTALNKELIALKHLKKNQTEQRIHEPLFYDYLKYVESVEKGGKMNGFSSISTATIGSIRREMKAGFADVHYMTTEDLRKYRKELGLLGRARVEVLHSVRRVSVVLQEEAEKVRAFLAHVCSVVDFARLYVVRCCRSMAGFVKQYPKGCSHSERDAYREAMAASIAAATDVSGHDAGRVRAASSITQPLTVLLKKQAEHLLSTVPVHSSIASQAEASTEHHSIGCQTVPSDGLRWLYYEAHNTIPTFCDAPPNCIQGSFLDIEHEAARLNWTFLSEYTATVGITKRILAVVSDHRKGAVAVIEALWKHRVRHIRSQRSALERRRCLLKLEYLRGVEGIIEARIPAQQLVASMQPTVPQQRRSLAPRRNSSVSLAAASQRRSVQMDTPTSFRTMAASVTSSDVFTAGLLQFRGDGGGGGGGGGSICGSRGSVCGSRPTTARVRGSLRRGSMSATVGARPRQLLSRDGLTPLLEDLC